MNPLRARIDAVPGTRKRTNAPKDVVFGRFAFVGDVKDNDATATDLTGSGALKSAAITDRLGITLLSTANPLVVVVAERIGVMLHLGVETDLIAQAVMRELALKHSPVGDEDITIDLFSFYAGSFGGTSGVIATGGFGAAAKKVETFDLVDSPLVINCSKDGLDLFTHTAVNGGAAIPCTIFVDGYAFSSQDYRRSDWVDELPGGGMDLFAVHEERARSNAARVRRYGADKDAVFMSGVELDAKRRPRLLRKRK